MAGLVQPDVHPKEFLWPTWRFGSFKGTPCESVCLSLCDPVSRIKVLGFPKEPSVEWYVRGLRDADIPWNAPCPQLGPIFSRTHRSFYHNIVTWYWLSSTNVLDHRGLNKSIFLSARRAWELEESWSWIPMFSFGQGHPISRLILTEDITAQNNPTQSAQISCWWNSSFLLHTERPNWFGWDEKLDCCKSLLWVLPCLWRNLGVPEPTVRWETCNLLKLKLDFQWYCRRAGISNQNWCMNQGRDIS